VKYGIFIFNLISALAGIALIVVGALPLIKLEDIKEAFPENDPATLPVVLVVLGSVIFIISFFGCWGAIRENQCMVTTYAFFLLVLVVGQIIIAVFAFLYNSDLADAAENGFEKLWNDMTQQSDEKSSQAIFGIQTALHCCGNNAPVDWTDASLAIPKSCCSDLSETCNASTPGFYNKGCGSTLNNLVTTLGSWIAWVALISGAFDLVGVIFACCLASSIRSSNRRSRLR